MRRRCHLSLPVLLTLVLAPPARAAGPRELVHAWARRHGLDLASDVRLDRVAREHAAALDELAGRPPVGAAAFFQFLLEREQVSDAVVHGVAIPLSGEVPMAAQVEESLQRAAGGSFTHFGAGRAGRILTVVLARRVVQVSVRRSACRLELCIRPEQPLRQPSLLVTFPSGRVLERRWGSGSAGPSPRCFSLPAAPGRHQVEVMVEGEYGPEVAALYPLYVGIDPPRFPRHKLYPTEEPGQVELRLVRLVNRARRQAGLGPLRRSGALAEVARAHSEDMLAAGYFGHVSPRGQTLAGRLQASGIRYRQASENLALATGLHKAHDSLMASPGHRRTLLDPQLTHIGVGIAGDPARGLIYVTQVLVRY